MKKVCLTKQLFIIYSIVLLAITLTFFSVLSGWLIEIYIDVNYNKLDDFAGTIETIIDEGYNLETLEFNNNIEYVVWYEGNVYHTSDNLNSILSEDYINNLYSKIVGQLQPNEHHRSTLDNIDNYFYTAFKTESGYYIVTASSGLLINQMKQETGIQIMILFTIILLGGGLIIIFWSNSLVSRIAKISSFVIGMKSTSYSISNIDDGEDEIGQLSVCIDEMRKQIYDNEETKKEIIQNLSHDIKTPIAVIKSYAEAIVDEIETKDAGKIIIRQSDLLQSKAERLLQLNRLNYLEIDKPFEKININQLITRVVNNTKYLTNLTFELDLDDSIFMGYEENYQTMIENIVSNAIRFAKTKIVIELKNSRLSFYNDGEPIEEKFLINGFKAFEMGSKGEFGVGMSIVKKIIEFFNLELHVRNENDGVLFIIAAPNIK